MTEVQELNHEKLEGMLASRSYDDKYTNVPTANIGSELRDKYRAIFDSVGEEMPESFLTVKADKGLFQNLYVPQIYRITGEQAQTSAYGRKNADKYGEGVETVGIKFSRELMIPLDAFPEGSYEVDERGITFAINEGSENEFYATFDYFFADWENPPAISQLRKASKKNELHKLLAEVKSGGSAKTLKELEENTEYSVVGYEAIETPFGGNFILDLADGTRVFGNSSVQKTLNNSPNISPEMPATLIIGEFSTTKQGKTRVNAIIQTSSQAYSETSDIDLDW